MKSVRYKCDLMDLLHAANYLEELDREENAKALKMKSAMTPKNVLKEVTNTNHILPKFKSLLHGKLRRSVTPEPFLTPKKKRRISVGKENKSPQTPKCIGKTLKKQIESPPTPLSNLKMLIKIASTQSPLKDCETDRKSNIETEDVIKKFFSEVTLPKKVEEVSLKKHLTYGDENTDVSQPQFTEPSRKEKSLGVLVDRFLFHFPLVISCMETPRKMVIDDMATILSTERRRVYDIINILESLNMAERIHKNTYQWIGNRVLVYTLSRLKRLAVQWGVQSGSGMAPFHPDNLQSPNPDFLMARKNKSLGVLCQKFMMLLLVSPAPHIVHLDAAICFLLGQDMDSSNQNRTKGRRIYDIANVLVSLKLVKRLPQSKSFQYIGPVVTPSKENEDIYGQLSKTRHSLLSPSQMMLSDGKCINYQPPQLERTPLTSSNIMHLKKREVKIHKDSAPKAKRNCLVMSAKSNSVTTSKVLPVMAKNETLFKIPPVDAQLLKTNMLFEPRPAQIVTASKAKSVTYIHPNMKNLEYSNTNTRVALTFDQNKTPNENISPVFLKKPEFCMAANISSTSTVPRNSPYVPMMFVGNGLRPLQNIQPVRNGVKPLHNTISAGNYLKQNTQLVENCFNPLRNTHLVRNVVQGVLSNPDLVPHQDITPITVVNNECKRISPPSISFNTLSKHHYKTVIGPVSQKPQLSCENSGYRLVIRNTSSLNSPLVDNSHATNEFVTVIHHINETKD